MKKNFFILYIFSIISSFSTQAFTEKEWSELIIDSIETSDDLTWKYDSKKLKSYSNMVKDTDIQNLTTLALSDDLQLSEASKYLLALQGEYTNEYMINNYLEDNDVKNGMYYLNLNFSYTLQKENFWQILKNKENVSKSIVKDTFENCKNFKSSNDFGGKVFTLKNEDDFFVQKALMENYTYSDLMYLEMDLIDSVFPVTVTLYDNKYTIEKENENNCVKSNENLDLNYIQKILALYKQHNRNTELEISCKSFEENAFLKSKLNYLCRTK